MAAPEQQMKTLVYGVLGTARIDSVTITPGATMIELRRAIFDREKCRTADPNFRYRELELYIPEDPQVGDERLRGEDEDIEAFLREARAPISGFKKLAPFDVLNAPTCFGLAFSLRQEEIHVLVEIVELTPPVKRQRVSAVRWILVEGEYPPGDVETTTLRDRNSDARREWVTVPARFLQGSGFATSESEDLVLYKRPQVEDQWTMIQTCAIDAQAALYIVGARGSGKSCAAYAFACSQVDREKWTVVWIHTDEDIGVCYCVKFDGMEKATAIVEASAIVADIEAMLDRLQQPGRGIIVFYDGYVELLKPVCVKLLWWQSQSPPDRRLVCVSSTVSLGKSYKLGTISLLPAPPSWPPRLSTGTWQTSLRMMVKFELHSWTLDEYIEAIQYSPFFESVKTALMMPSDERRTLVFSNTDEVQVDSVGVRSQYVMTKYDIAGGSARLMFGVRSEAAIAILDTSMELSGDLRAVVEYAVGWGGDSGVNQLYARYSRDNAKRTELVSMYVARKAALQLQLL